METDTTKFENLPPKEELKFGNLFCDHMLTIEWNEKEQWKDPKIIPFQDLKINPGASCFHYGLECFEGLKAYKCPVDNSVRLFRPDLNAKRLARSMARLKMPGDDFDSNELVECIKKLVKVDEKWIPDGNGFSLYIRPVVISTCSTLGVVPPDELLLYVITSPVGPYLRKGGFDPIRLVSDTQYVRAWPGGTGDSKVGGNYAPTLKASGDAAKRGYHQNLWLFGENEEITECGAMNIFFFMTNKTTQKLELVTPPLTRGDILPGVTRDSILALARAWNEFDVVERYPTMPEIVEAVDEGRLIEVFASGTAAVVTPVDCIEYRGKDLEIPTGNLTKRIYDEITGIQYGRIEGPPGWSVIC